LEEEEIKKELRQLLSDYGDIFCKSLKYMGKTDLIEKRNVKIEVGIIVYHLIYTQIPNKDDKVEKSVYYERY